MDKKDINTILKKREEYLSFLKNIKSKKKSQNEYTDVIEALEDFDKDNDLSLYSLVRACSVYLSLIGDKIRCGVQVKETVEHIYMDAMYFMLKEEFVYELFPEKGTSEIESDRFKDFLLVYTYFAYRTAYCVSDDIDVVRLQRLVVDMLWSAAAYIKSEVNKLETLDDEISDMEEERIAIAGAAVYASIALMNINLEVAGIEAMMEDILIIFSLYPEFVDNVNYINFVFAFLRFLETAESRKKNRIADISISTLRLVRSGTCGEALAFHMMRLTKALETVYKDDSTVTMEEFYRAETFGDLGILNQPEEMAKVIAEDAQTSEKLKNNQFLSVHKSFDDFMSGSGYDDTR